jgi:hypothetical protein
VKGIDFQYGFLFAPVAFIGAALLAAWLVRRRPRIGPSLVVAWALGVVAVNASAGVELGELRAAHRLYRHRHEFLAAAGVRRESRVAADNCTAPLLVERDVLLPICYVDFERFARTGLEPIDVPVAAAVEADRIVVHRGCPSYEGCLELQLARAAAAGYRLLAEEGPLVVLGRSAEPPGGRPPADATSAPSLH